MERVIAYVDGFNLYYGMKENGNQLLWLNVQALISSLLEGEQKLMFINYFTSRIKNNPQKQQKQKVYIEALETLTDFAIIYGHFQSYSERCQQCGYTYPYSSEKMTDVNIAVSLLEDAFMDKYDTAFLITGDSDLIPSINLVHKLFPSKRVFVAFPPNRQNMSIKNVVKSYMVLGRKKLMDAQFPEQVKNMFGYILKRPDEWK